MAGATRRAAGRLALADALVVAGPKRAKKCLCQPAGQGATLSTTSPPARPPPPTAGCSLWKAGGPAAGATQFCEPRRLPAAATAEPLLSANGCAPLELDGCTPFELSREEPALARRGTWPVGVLGSASDETLVMSDLIQPCTREFGEVGVL